MPTTKQASTLVGKVEKIDFTSGGAGNQWTTINGVRYATWWDFKQGVRTGRVVHHRPYKAPLWHGNPPIDCTNIVLVEVEPT